MIREKLMRVQTELKAPKNLYNSFGKYKYRNAESICEAVKPFLLREGLILTLSDNVVQMGERFYLVAEAKLTDVEDGESISTCGYARESDEKKGMDSSQVTGATSSYARKYALNGLFLLDDTKDADSDEYHKQTHPKAEKVETIDRAMAETLKGLYTGDNLEKLLAFHKIKKIEELPMEAGLSILQKLAKESE